MELEQDIELEEVYRDLFEGRFREKHLVPGKTVRDYITDMKNDVIRGEMDYFVSYCLEFGINVSRIKRLNGNFTYDYYAAAGGELHHAGMMLTAPMALYPHRHDYYELVYVLSGRLKHRIGGQELTLRRDDMLLLDLNTVHMEYVDDASVVQYLQLPRATVEAIVKDGCLQPEIEHFFSMHERKRPNDFRYIYLEHRGNAQLRKLLVWIFREKMSGRPGSRYIIYGLLTRLLYSLGTTPEYYPHLYIEEEKGETKILRLLNKYLETHFWQVDPETLEREMHYSCNYLNKLVRKSTGLSFTEYCISRRLDYAAGLLINSEMSVGEIIDRCGYQNRSYFYRVFRNRFGQSPLEYRKEHTPKT